MSEAPVLLDIEDGVARLRLNRPEASNGMNDVLLKALYQAFMTCKADRRVRAVVLSGNGKNFCAGGDVKDFSSKGENLPDYLRVVTNELQIAVAAMIRLDAPVIAAVQGFAAGGGGFGLVCAADLVVAAKSAKFMSGAVRVGMAPDAGTSVTLSRLVGMRRATEILLTNPVISADEALSLGIVNKVVPDDELESAAMAMARDIAESAPKAIAATKRLLWNGISLSVEACLPEEARTVSELSGTADSREGLAAVIERRKPKFFGN